MTGALLLSCRPNPPASARPARVADATAQTSASCQHCHAEIFAAWSPTDHANANRPVAERDRVAFTATTHLASGGADFDLGWVDGKPAMNERRADAPTIPHAPKLVLGSKPLWQPLVPAPGNRWQPTDMAFDPAKKEWFNVFGDEHRQPGEWGHWTGRGMNWNSMCAHCHMTGFQKNYIAATDSYASTWVEHGVGCIQCHGPMPSDHAALAPGAKKSATPPAPPFFGDRQRMMQTCAPCHARNELLTAEFQPGENYSDHFRLTLPVDPAVFYPDGQQRDEDFNWTSFQLSRMGGHGGVTCFDCHDPHTTKTLLPATNNLLCLRCHGAPGVNKAPVIDPLAHSHHPPDSTGNQCVTCHMPTTNYMQRAPRHDHGFLKPDPLLTRELGIPNACNRCHTDQSTNWAIAQTDAWYGTRLDSSQRARTRAVAAAQQHQPTAGASLLALLAQEEVPTWRATLLELAAPYASNTPTVVTAARASLAARDPLERAAAVRLLAEQPDAGATLAPALNDPSRLVRLDAAWALSPTLTEPSPARAELDAYLALTLDQPAGHLRLGQDLANRGRLPDAEKEMQLAATWDPFSPGIRDALGFVLNAENKPLEAAAAFFRAAQLQPADAQPAYRAGLAFASAGRLADAETALRLAVQRDPQFDRAWYNLGLLLAQTDRLTEATTALQHAESLTANTPDYPYALATVLLRTGDRAGALAAARRTLALDPNNAAARALLQAR